MSKCWYCNEELTTANYCDEHTGICTKCYNSMFKVSNEFVKGLTDKIADLEAKLAESEKRLVNCVDFDTWQKTVKENKELKQQLAEKEKQLQELPNKIIERVQELSVFDFKAYEDYDFKRYTICDMALDNILKEYKEIN